MKIAEHELGALTRAVALILLGLFVIWLGHSDAQEKGKSAGSEVVRAALRRGKERRNA